MEVTRSEGIERADVGAAFKHSRRAIRPLGRAWTPCSHSPAQCSRTSVSARSRLELAAGDLERAQRATAELPDPGRLPAIAATVEENLATARANAGTRDLVEEPTAAELAVLQCLATGLSRREISARLYISLNTVKTHTNELYPKAGGNNRPVDAVARAQKRSACSTSPNHPGDPPPPRPKPLPRSGMLRRVCHRLATASASKENRDHATPPRSTGSRSAPIVAARILAAKDRSSGVGSPSALTTFETPRLG